MKYIGYALLSLVAVVAIVFFFGGLDLASYSFFAPKIAAVDNKVFHESQQYNDGMVRDLENLRLAYLQADIAGKQALKGTIVHRFSVYPRDKMPPELQSFYDSVVAN